MTRSLQLERELESLALHSAEAKQFYDSYHTAKAYLAREYYGWIQAACPYYTEHGEPHIASVIASAGMLLANTSTPTNNPSPNGSLTALDIYVILGAIIWHDVGNVLSRRGHADKILPMMESIRIMAFPSVAVYKAVASVARSHSGQKGLSLVARHPPIVHTSHETYPVDLKALAAIVRFADEISENQTRISQEMLARGVVPMESRIYWEYANCITSCYPDLARDRVVVNLQIERAKAAHRFPCADYPDRNDDQGCISLIEYILCRLEKMNEERAYCAAEFRNYAAIRHIETRFTLVDDPLAPPDPGLIVTFGDSGMRTEEDFPHIKIVDPFFDANPSWAPDAIAETLHGTTS